MSDYYCPNCGADIGEQEGFDPYDDYYFCKECGQLLVNPDSDDSGLKYPDTRWFCDNCEACLNKQDGFSDWLDTWECTECGYENRISENEIYKSDDEYRNKKENNDDGVQNRCPNCNAALNEQWLYSELEEDWDCTECGVHLHHDYWNDEYIIVDEGDDEDNDEDYDDEDYDEDDDESVEYSGEINSATSNSNDRIFDYEEYEKQRKKEAQKIARAEKRRAFRKRHWKAYLITVLVFILSIAGIFAYNEYKQYIPIEYDSNELIGLDYKDVVKKLENNGFNNIRTNEIKDLLLEEKTFENMVSEIKINDSNSFEYGAKYRNDTNITVTFHSLKNVTIPFSSESLEGKDFKEIKTRFENLGFSNIKTTPKYDLITGWLIKNGEVEIVSINGNDYFLNGAICRIDAEIEIVYHTFKKNKPKT